MDISQAIANRLHYYKHQRNIIKAHETKAALNHLRREWLEKQKKQNYQNEYDRIRGILSSGHLPGQTTNTLKKREKELEELGAQALKGLA